MDNQINVSENSVSKKSGKGFKVFICIFLVLNFLISATALFFTVFDVLPVDAQREIRLEKEISEYYKKVGKDSIKSLNVKKDNSGTLNYIKGTLYNDSDKSFSSVLISISFIKDGETIRSGSDYTYDFSPGESYEFSVYAPDSYDKYEIRYISAVPE